MMEALYFLTIEPRDVDSIAGGMDHADIHANASCENFLRCSDHVAQLRAPRFRSDSRGSGRH